MPRPTTISKHLRHEFTPDELAELGGKLTDQYDELKTIDEELDAVKADYRERNLCATREIRRLSRLIKGRFDMRSIECRYEWNTPDSGRVIIRRIDTSDIVQERPMTDDERQEELPLEAAPEQPSETPAAETPAETTETIAAEIETPVEAEAATAAD